MSNRALAPIIVGITGKRDLRGEDEAVRAALIACFDLLDDKFPASPKILLSGLAAGTDFVAAKEAVERENWRLVAALPLPPDLYEQDFDQTQLADFQLLVNKDGVRWIVLDPLRDPATNQAYSRETLSRSANASTAARPDHYEQLGLYIVEHCSILIGVMSSSELPGKIGGTARIIDYRVRGTPDEIARSIIERSEMLPPWTPLDGPQPAPAWLIDLDRVGKDAANSPLRAVDLWRPSLAEPWGRIDVEKITWQREQDLINDLSLAGRIEVLNRQMHQIGDERWERYVEARARREEAASCGKADASSRLRRFHAAMSVIQGADKRDLKLTVAALALLFVVAVFVLELFIASEARAFLALYLFLLLVSLLVFALARLRRWQQYTEDYRAVAEALRVQLVWWDAGLSQRGYRVDRCYLFGTSGSLGIVRATIRHLIDAALLELGPPSPLPGADTDWIKGQIDYFTNRTSERQRWIAVSNDLIWFLFVASISMAFALVTSGLELPRLGISTWYGAMFVTFVPVGLFWLAHRLSGMARRQSVKRQRFFLNVLASVIAGAVGILLWLGISVLAPLIFDVFRLLGDRSFDLHLGADALGTKLVLMLATIATAVAGALRFYVEKLAFEPELHRYREALAIFQRAQNELSKLGGDVSQHKKKECLLIAVGEEALKENEAWIRAHRVRPLEPHL
jgi:hypothetical protein